MLTKARDYETLQREFRWQIPVRQRGAWMPDWRLTSAWDSHRVPPNLAVEADRCPSNIMLRLPPCTKLIRVGFPIAHVSPLWMLKQ
jgi:hypothetical protein